MKVLLTGAAGFIGFHLAKSLISYGYDVVGLDNINDYYDTNLKKNRLNILNSIGMSFVKGDLSNTELVNSIFNNTKLDYVIHLAAQAGVRYSIDNPFEYISSNIVGFQNIIEGCRIKGVKHFLYASSSSVYGLNTKIPFSENDVTDSPASLYAATKKSNELVAFTYSHLYGLPSTGLRFFTVYGPWGRPDMAYYKFVKNIINGDYINVFGNGKMYRDFTYIDDVVNAILKLIPVIPKIQGLGSVQTEIYNIGNKKPHSLEYFIETIEAKLNMTAKKIYKDIQSGDVFSTAAENQKLKKTIGDLKYTDLKTGISNFVDWYKDYYL